MRVSSAQTYVLYEREDGTATSHWRDRYGPTVPGVFISERYPTEGPIPATSGGRP